MTASVTAIIGATCAEFQITEEQFYGFLTREHLKHARFAAAFLIEEQTSLKGSQISRALGRSGDGHTARNMISRAKTLIGLDEVFAEKVSSIREGAKFWEPARALIRPVPEPKPAEPILRKHPDDPNEVVEMRRENEKAMLQLRLALLREREVVE